MEIRSDITTFLERDLKVFYRHPAGPDLLDCVHMGFSKKIPTINQPENELIDRTKWQLSKHLPLKSLERYIGPHPCEWLCSSREKTDRISKNEMESNPVSSSLTLLHLNEADNEPEILHSTPIYGSPRLRLKFAYEGMYFNLSLTDKKYPILQSEYSDEKMLEDFYVTVGIGELFPSTSSYHIYVVGFIPLVEDRPL